MEPRSLPLAVLTALPSDTYIAARSGSGDTTVNEDRPHTMVIN